MPKTMYFPMGVFKIKPPKIIKNASESGLYLYSVESIIKSRLQIMRLPLMGEGGVQSESSIFPFRGSDQIPTQDFLESTLLRAKKWTKK